MVKITLGTLITVFIIVSACKKADTSNDTRYYSKEVFNKKFISLYAKWGIVKIKKGSATETPEFDYLTFEKFGVFRVYKNNNLLSEGKVTIDAQDTVALVATFNVTQGTQVVGNSTIESKFTIKKDSLFISERCTDCDEYSFIKK
jgi:hypothetical protein